MQSWLEGRNCVGKGVHATGLTASLIILSSKADSNTWESFTRSGLKLEWVHQESPRSDIFRKGTTKLILKQKHSQKHFTWAKEKNNWTFAQWSKILFLDKSTLNVRRFRSIRSRTNRLRDSFFPQAIRLMNSQKWPTLQHTPTHTTCHALHFNTVQPDYTHTLH